jgi:hypothetical protein
MRLPAARRNLLAEKRDDISYRANRIDLSKARLMRVLEVRLYPGHEGEFAEGLKKLTAAYEKTESDLPCVVYRVDVAMPSPIFFCDCADENSSSER